MKSKKKVISIVLFLTVSMILVSCQKQKAQWKGTIEKVNGVTVVKNPKEPLYSGNVLYLEEDLTIGEEEKEPVFEAVRTIRVDEGGNIYVLDYKALQIKVFDESGKHLRDISRKGQGPGEMQLPRGMEIIAGKKIVIDDFRNRRISFFSLEGELLKEIPTSEISGLAVVTPDSRGQFIGYTLYMGENALTELIKFDENLNAIKKIGKIEYSRERNFVNPFMPFIFFTVLQDDRVVWGNWYNYQLMVIDKEGETVRKIIKAHVPIKITDDDKKRETEERFKDIKFPPGMSLKFPEYYPAFRYISVDDEGRIFVRTFERDEENNRYYDVFDSEGRYIAKIRLRNHPTTWKKGKLYCAIEDEDGFHQVKRYKVTWKY